MEIQLTERFSIYLPKPDSKYGSIEIYKDCFKLKELAEALLKADELGWELNYGLSYSTGYYDSVDSIMIDVQRK